MKKKLMFIIVGIVVVLGLAVGIPWYIYTTGSYVATVAGEKITTEEYKFFLNNVKAMMLDAAQVDTNNAATVKDFWNKKIDGEDPKEKAKKDALDQAKEFKLQLIKAKDSKISLTQDELKKINTDIDNYTSGKTTSEANKAFLEQYGINKDEFKKVYTSYMTIEKYRTDRTKNIAVSEDEAKQFYDKNKDQIDNVTVRHVLFLTAERQADGTMKKLPDDKVAAAKKNADDIYNKVKNGEDIGELAKQHSEDPGSKDDGGKITFYKKQMVQPFEDFAFSKPVGEVGIVETEYGYHVMKVEAKNLDFEASKDLVKGYVANQKYADEIKKMKEDSKYNVQINKNPYNAIKVV